MYSKRIEFEKLANTRDLGGMVGAGGKKVRPGKLYRSGHLFFASPKDLEKLSEMIEISVDFRSVQECLEKGEPVIPGVTYYHLPILEEERAGVTRDKKSFAEVREKMLQDESIALNYMSQTYQDFIVNEHSVSQYEKFIRLLLEDHQKGVLWHCTAGKDRAGFGTIIVQELLGISREDIIEDYLYTNVCLEQEIQSLTESICSIEGVDREKASKALFYVFGADASYLGTLYETVAEKYGNFQNYLNKALHITPEEQAKFREMYLE